MTIMKTKICRDCKGRKSVADFYQTAKGVVFPYCKGCQKARSVKWRRDNPEAWGEIKKRFKENHPNYYKGRLRG